MRRDPRPASTLKERTGVMDMPLTLINLAGCVALLLWGTHMVQSGVQRSFGPNLRSLLDGALRTRLHAFVAGLGVTSLLQSSTATGLMVTGFAAGGLVDLVPALAVMLGANVGTTLIVQVLSFDIESVAPVLILIGVMLFRRGPAFRARDLGRPFIGLGLMLIALHQLVQLFTPFEDSPSLRVLLGLVAATPILAAVIAAVLTWMAHSSAAIILVIVSMAGKGVVSPDMAVAMMLGANVGTAINPVLEGGSGDDPATRRLPIGNLVMRAVGALVCLAALAPLGRWLMTVEPNPARAVADAHTLFNAALALLFLPLLPSYAALLKRWLPTRINPVDPSRPLYLDQAALEAPFVALGAAAREALRLIDVLETMLEGAQDALVKGDRSAIAASSRLDDILDSLNVAIRTYLTSLDSDSLSDEDHRRMTEIFGFVSHLEQAGDAVVQSLLPLALKRLDRGWPLSPTNRTELPALFDRVRANARIAASLMMTADPRGARMLADEKRGFRELESEATRSYLDGLRLGRAGSAEMGAWTLDVLRELKRVNASLVAASAYPILEREGGLLPSRLADGG